MTRSLDAAGSNAAPEAARAVDQIGQIAQGGGAAPIALGVDPAGAFAQGFGVGDVTARVYLRVGTSDSDIEIAAAFLSGEGSFHGA